jgi:hypothetical protein
MRARAVLAAALLVPPGAALAASSGSATDPDDSPSKVDLAGVRGAHNRVQDRLVHSLRTYDPFRPADLGDPNGPPGSICLDIWTTRQPGDSPPNYDVCVTADRRGRHFRGSVSRHGAGDRARKIGRARVEHPAARRLVIRFDPDLIRRPSSYLWRAESRAFAPGCRRPTGCEDTAPNAPRTVRTKLGTPRS